MRTYQITVELTSYSYLYGTQRETLSREISARSYNKAHNQLLDELEAQRRADIKTGKIYRRDILVL